MRALSINEIKRGSTLPTIGVGIKKPIADWLHDVGIDNYKILDDNTIDVFDDVDFIGQKMEQLPEFIQFNSVNGGDFNISGVGLMHLRGVPYNVDGSFYCQENELESLEFCPLSVTGLFVCFDNNRRFSKQNVNRKCKVYGGSAKIFIDSDEFYDYILRNIS